MLTSELNFFAGGGFLKFNKKVLTAFLFSLLLFLIAFTSLSFAVTAIAKPDLTIGGINFENTLIQTVPNTLSVEVINNGQLSSGITSKLYVSISNSNYSNTSVLFDVPPLQAGEKVNVNVENVILKKGYSHAIVYAKADYYKIIPESNEINNSKAKTFSGILINKPDFIIKSVKFDPENPIEGKLFTAIVTVKNKSAVSYKGQIEVQLKNLTENYNQVKTVEGIDANQETEVIFSDINAMPGSYIGTAIVDPSNKIAESNETNNFHNTKIDVTKKFANLVVAEILIDVEEFGIGDTVKTTIKIKNIGNKETNGGFFTKITTEGATTSVTIIPYNDIIQPDEIVSLEAFEIKVSDLKARVTATADFTNAVLENNEEDNIKTQEFTAMAPNLPNLIVGEITISPTIALTPTTLTIAIINNGQADIIKPFFATIQSTNPSNTILLLVGELKKGETKSLELNNLGFNPGAVNISVSVDSTKTIIESNEADNTASKDAIFE